MMQSQHLLCFYDMQAKGSVLIIDVDLIYMY